MTEHVKLWWSVDPLPEVIREEALRIADLSSHYLAAMECKRALKRRRDMLKARGGDTVCQAIVDVPLSVASVMTTTTGLDRPLQRLSSRSRKQCWSPIHQGKASTFGVSEQPRESTRETRETRSIASQKHEVSGTQSMLRRRGLPPLVKLASGLFLTRTRTLHRRLHLHPRSRLHPNRKATRKCLCCRCKEKTRK